MANHALLNNVDHQDLKIITEKSAAFGNNQMYSMVFPFEFKHVQANYPIFFHKDEATDSFVALALFGFEQGENLFLNEGDWAASYIPLMVEREPFLIGTQQVEVDGELTDNPVIHIDLDSPRVSQERGQSLFLPHGGNSEYLNKISATLKAIHESKVSTAQFMAKVTELSLLEPFNLDIRLSDGTDHRLSGFYTINEERLSELTAEQLFTLNQSGMLTMIYMVIASHSHINHLIQLKDKK